ncbi:MAG TPA: Gldg family protein, partial [Gemmataceae bacterium]
YGLYALLAAATVFVVLAAYWAVRAYNRPAAEEAGEAALVPLILAIASGLLASVGLAGAGWIRFAPAQPGRERTWARWLLLLTFGSAGLVLVLAGFALAYEYRQGLLRWVNDGDATQARWFLLSVFAAVLGLGLMFAGAQASRGEERTEPMIRPAVYGINTFVTTVLLVLILAVANVAAYMKLPGVLDTTREGFYSLSDTSRNLIAQIDRPVRAYLILSPDSRYYVEMRTLLSNLEDANPRFRAQTLSPTADDARIRELIRKYPALRERDPRGVLLVYDPEGTEQVGFVPASDFEDIGEAADPRERAPRAFQGEAKLMTELAFLAEARQKPVIYFLTGHGELVCEPGPGRPPEESASRLYQYLTDRNFEVKTLTFDPLEQKPRVPGDATVVVIAGLNETLPPPAVNALKEYVQPEDPKAPKGKLFVLFDTFEPFEAGQPLRPSGLETLLTGMGADVGSQYVLAVGTDAVVSPAVNVVVSDSALGRDNPIAVRFRRSAFDFLVPRSVSAALNPGGRFDALELLTTDALLTWREGTPPADLGKSFQAMFQDPNLRKEKQAQGRGDPVPVAVLSSERPPEGETGAPKPRLAVFGSSYFLSDAFPARLGQAPTYFALFAATLDWLRERPTNIGIEPRVYNVYRLSEDATTNRLLVMPLLLVALGILGLGTGVWVSRRR